MIRKRSRSPSQDADPTCPICLCDIQAVKDRTVVAGCMHVFCLPCLQRWVTYKRFCPLCKRPIKSYLYDIRSDDSYNECVLPDVAPSGGPGRHSRWETPDSTYQQQQTSRTAAPGVAATAAAPRVPLRSEAWYTWGPAEGAGGSRRWRRDDRHQQQQQRQRRRRRSGHTTSSSGSSGEGEVEEGQQPGAVQPRPYYWRLQQRMLASSEPALTGPPTGSGRGFATGAASNGAAAAAAGMSRPPPPRGHMRQQVYDLGLWAQPPAPSPAAAASASRSNSNRGSQQPSSAAGMVGRVSQRAAEAWVDRDLQELLQEEDVMIVRAYVMGLIHSFGLQATDSSQAAASQQQVMVAAAQAAAAQATRQQQQQQQQVVPETLTGPVASLRGFLFDKAAHFWHELCCFAGAGYTQDTYDRLVKYSWPVTAEAAAAAAGAPSRSPSPAPARRATGGASSVRDATAGSVPPPAGVALPNALWDATPPPPATAAAVAAWSGARAADGDSMQLLLVPHGPRRSQQATGRGSPLGPVYRSSSSGGMDRVQPLPAGAPTPPHAALHGGAATVVPLDRAQGGGSGDATEQAVQEHGSSSGRRRRRGRSRSRSRQGSPDAGDLEQVQQAAPAAVQLQPDVQEQEPPMGDGRRHRHKSSRKSKRKHRRDSSRHRSSSRRHSRRKSSRHRSHSSSSGRRGDGGHRSLEAQPADRACRTMQGAPSREEEDSQGCCTRPWGSSPDRGALPRPAVGSTDSRRQAADLAAASTDEQLSASGNRHAIYGSKQDLPRHQQPSAVERLQESVSEGLRTSSSRAVAHLPVGHVEQGASPEQLPHEQRAGVQTAAQVSADRVAPGGEGLQHRKKSSCQVMLQQELQHGGQDGRQGGPEGASTASASAAARPPAAMSRAAMLARVAELKASLNARRLGAQAPVHHGDAS